MSDRLFLQIGTEDSEFLCVLINLIVLLVVTLSLHLILYSNNSTLRAERTIEGAATRHSHEVPTQINVDSGRIWGTSVPKGVTPNLPSGRYESLWGAP